MWQHNYEPLGSSLALSAPVAALPIVVLFLMLGVFRSPAWKAAGSPPADRATSSSGSCAFRSVINRWVRRGLGRIG